MDSFHGASSSSSSSRSSSLSSPLRPVQQPATSKPTYSPQVAVSAGSRLTPPSGFSCPDVALAQNRPKDLTASDQFLGGSASNRSNINSTNNWPPNLLASSHHSGMSASSWLIGNQMAGASTVVPLQANFKPLGAPKSSTITAVATHIDEQCHIFVHELNSGLYPQCIL